MTARQQAGAVRAYFYNENALAMAAEAGLYQVRGLNGRMLNFYEEAGALVARVLPDQAEYLAGIEGFEVEGFAVKTPAPQGTPDDWEAEGRRLREERDHGQAQAPAAAPAQTDNALLAKIFEVISPEQLLAALLPSLKADAVQSAQALVDADRQAAEKREALRPWTYSDVANKVEPDDLRELVIDFAPKGTDVYNMTDGAVATMAVRIANEIPGFEHRLSALLGE